MGVSFYAGGGDKTIFTMGDVGGLFVIPSAFTIVTIPLFYIFSNCYNFPHFQIFIGGSESIQKNFEVQTLQWGYPHYSILPLPNSGP